MADPERGLWEMPNFKQVPKFLKSNRILFAYRLTSNEDQTFIDKSCFGFLLYRGICRFCAIFGRFGGGAWPRLAPLHPPLKIMAPHPRLIRICVYCIPTDFKDNICIDYFQKIACKVSPA